MSSSPAADEGVLRGRRIVVTRARERMGEIAVVLEARGAEVVFFPTIELQPIEDTSALDAALQVLDRYDAVLFGSKSASDVVLARAEALGVSVSRPVACVGKKTLAAVRPRVAGEVIAPEVHRAEALVELVARRFGGVLRGRRFLFPRAPEGREVIMDLLEAAGAEVDTVDVYRIVSVPSPPVADLDALEGVDAFTFLSGETLRAFLEVMPEQRARALLAKALVAVIGPVARARAEALGVRVDLVPEVASIEALVEALVKRLGSKV